MTLVVDPSVGAKSLVRETGLDAARLINDPQPLIAPDRIPIEAASAMLRKIKRSGLPAIHDECHSDVLPEVFERPVPARDALDDAFRLAQRPKHPVCDCVDPAAAIREDRLSVTDDADLMKSAIAGGHSRHVRALR